MAESFTQLMIKKVSAVLLTIVLVLGLGACSTAGEPTSSADTSTGVPVVDRDPQGALPNIVFDDDGVPVMETVQADPPAAISVKTLQEGDGDPVTEGAFVTVDYAGFVWADGSQFDGSYGTGTPARFSLNQVVDGWKYGLADTKAGDRVLVVIPPEYGYGDTDNGSIPGGSTLVFVVDILGTMSVTTDALTAAIPTDAALPEGLTVSGELGQEPTLTLAADAPQPTETQVVVIAEGAGDEITEDDSLFYHAVGGYWGDEATSSWQDTYQQVDSGGGEETIGKRIGSRILLAYPADEASGIPAYAIVIDILAAVPAA